MELYLENQETSQLQYLNEPQPNCNPLSQKIYSLATEIISNSRDLKESLSNKNPPSLSKRQIYPISNAGYPNLFYADTKEEQEELIYSLEQTFANLLPKIKMPFINPENNEISSTGFFDQVEYLVRKYDPDAQILLGGGSIRSILSFIYKDLFDAYLQGENPKQILHAMSLGQWKFSDQTPDGGILPMDILGNGSDIDIYIKFSKSSCLEDYAISNVKDFIENTLNQTKNNLAQQLNCPTPDIQEYNAQFERACSNGGSSLDWLCFPITKNSGENFVTPNQYPHILSDLCQGKFAYRPISCAENESITTARMYRSLLELPFLELRSDDELTFVTDLKKISKNLCNTDLKNRIQRIFHRTLESSRFPERINFEITLDHEEKTFERKKVLKEILQLLQYGQLSPLPELLPSIKNTQNLDLEMIQMFESKKFFMPVDEFIQDFTDQGVLYHGTPKTENLPSMMRGNLITSKTNQGASTFGRGFYTTASEELAKTYAETSGKVVEISLKSKDLKVINLNSIPRSIIKTLNTKAKTEGLDLHQYLEKFLQVDVIINEHILLQNTHCFSLENTKKQFSIDQIKKQNPWVFSELKNLFFLSILISYTSPLIFEILKQFYSKIPNFLMQNTGLNPKRCAI